MGGKATRFAIRSAALACALLLPASGSAQTARPSTARQTSSTLYRIAGTLANAATSEPIHRANLAILAVEDSHTVATVESDNEGRFSFDRVPAGKFQLTASKRGFRTSFYDEHEEFNSAIVAGPNQDTASLAFRLMPGGVLHGAVSTEGGDPVENAHVMLFQKPLASDASAHPAQSDSATTDDTGAYEFDNLAPGEYYLAVSAQPWYALHRSSARAKTKSAESTAPSDALDVAYPITYFDSSTDEASATALTITGGSHQSADITLHAVPALHIRIENTVKPDGRLIRAELRQTVFGTVIGAESSGFLESMQANPVTEFTDVAPGHYELAEGDPPRIAQIDATSNLQIDANAGAAAGSLHGIFRTPAGAALTQDAALTLEPVPGASAAAPIPGIATQGAFEFPSVPPGEWQLSGESGGQQLPIVSIAAAGRVQHGNLIAVPDHALSVVVTVSQGATRIEGFARRDGKGASGVMIVLLPKNTIAIQGLARRDQSDSDGSFALRDVVPGRYSLVAIEDGWSLDWTDPGVLVRYLPGAIPVTVSERSGKLVTLTDPVPAQPR